MTARIPWPTVRLGEALTRVSREEGVDTAREYPLLGVRLDGRGPFLRETVSGAETAAKHFNRVAKGDFIYSRLFAWRGAFGVVPEELDGAYVSDEFPTFTATPNCLDSEFLRYWFQLASTLERVAADCAGSTPLTRNRFKESFFLVLEIPLPPLAEQQRIVARIEELAALIDEARTLRRRAAEEIEQLVAARLRHLFESGSSCGWARAKLGDYIVEACYGTSEKTTDDSTGVPVLRMGNIQVGQLSTRALRYLHLSERERARLLLQRGDVLVNRTNSAELVGKCAVFDLAGEFSFASYLIRLRLDRQLAEPHLVAAFINSPLGRSFMLNEKRQMTGQANVNATKLRAMPVALPPLREQRRIVAELDALQAEVDAAKHLQAETTAKLDALLPSILDRAFKGRL